MKTFRLFNNATVLFSGILLSAILFGWVYSLETDKNNAEFSRSAHLRIKTLEKSMDDSIAGLKSINHLFASSPHPVSRQQFHQFVKPMLADYPYIQSFVFHRIVRFSERTRYEAAMRATYPWFVITEWKEGKLIPAAPREFYLVNDFVEPFMENKITLGFDSWSDPIQALAIRRAIDTGHVSASGLKRLLQRGGMEKGFTIIIPVYRKGVPLDDPQLRRQAFIGDTEAVFFAHGFVQQVLDRAGLLDASGTRIAVYAAGAPIPGQLVFQHGDAAPSRSTQPTWGHALVRGTPETVSHTFDLGGKPWHVAISPPNAPLLHTHPRSFLVFFLSIMMTLATAAMVRAAALREQKIAHLVEQRTQQLHLASRELTLRLQAIEACANAIVITSAQAPDYLIEYVNPAFCRITGYAMKEVAGQSIYLIAANDLHQAGIAELRAALDAGKEGHAVLHSYAKSGKMYWNDVYVSPVRDEDGVIKHFVHAHYDITEIKRYEQELEFRANHDTLTGLANRNLLQDRLNQAISYASRLHSPLWVAFVDLDRFKFINDSLGHATGDMVLQAVARRLTSVLRDTDTVSRIGGDEFVLVLPLYDAGHAGTETLQHVLEAIAEPIKIDGREHFITCSIGIATYPADGTSRETLLTNADIAMYRAKEMGRNNFQFFAPFMNAQTLERLRIEGCLRQALQNNEFRLHYQPQVDLHSGKIVGTEVLLRWMNRHLGPVPPSQFIGLAEETALIIPIGDWVLKTACMQAKAWESSGCQAGRIAVNLSAIQFSQPDIVDKVCAILRETGLAPQLLDVEITESMVMGDVENSIATLHRLKSLGIQLSIDDFGTAYSSLAYLKRFPIDVLKIDQAFVRDISTNPADAKIIITIISLAHDLGLHVIAEGVETREQLEFLRNHGCDQIQGNYFSQPLPSDQLGLLLKEGKHL